MNKTELKQLIREAYQEVLQEKIVTQQDLDALYKQIQDAPDEEQDKLWKQLFSLKNRYTNQYSGIIETLTSKTGYWYVGSAKAPLIKKLEEMDIEDYKKFRSEVAAFYKEVKNANAAMNKVKETANALIKKLED